MKLPALLLCAFSTSGVVAVGGGVLACTGVAESCYYLPYRSAQICSSLISQSGVPIATCQGPQRTITVTETSIPTATTTKTIRASTTTKTVTSTSTTRGSTFTLPPTTISSTQTVTTTSTSLYSTLSVISETTTRTETDPVTSTITESTTSTTSVAYIRTTCAYEKRDVFGNIIRSPDLPTDCSCFLTSTKLDNIPKSTTITLTQRTTVTSITLVGGTAPTVTSTVTKTKSTSLPGITLARSTSTSVSTKTVTKTISSSTTSTSTSTQTSITTTTIKTTETKTSTTAEVTNHPCRSPNALDLMFTGTPGYQSFAFIYPDGTEGDPSKCCYACWETQGCGFWAITPGSATCQLFVSTDEQEVSFCSTTQCPKGYPWVYVFPEDQSGLDARHFGRGPCAQEYITYVS